MVLKKYKITWTEREVTMKTIDKEITADTTDIAEMAKLGDFTFILIP